ncbi:heme exporter protein CcmB [uncultured Brevundimonas sp.]|uniref:heme exporter protein CcmB n=1 Tax=uncultured Brevundimonas sp. TaxID=213418 RepID=UPI0026130C7C|nr:heme exporter protein CcmB [uncultured Brevundimonas sp.]
MSGLFSLFRRELALAWGGGGGPLLACGFMICFAAMLPLAVGGDLSGLAPIASGAAWVALAVASLLSLERLFERDLEDGSLDILSLGTVPLEGVVVVKAVAQWLANGVPLALMAPVVALVLGQDAGLIALTGLTSLIGGLGFAFTGALAAALALGAKRGGVLIAVIVLPLFIPPVVFGAGALARAANDQPIGPALALLAAYVLFAMVITPLAGAAAVRNAQS